jgi:hypothetical protein
MSGPSPLWGGNLQGFGGQIRVAMLRVMRVRRLDDFYTVHIGTQGFQEGVCVYGWLVGYLLLGAFCTGCCVFLIG